jgi:hypothetical protein
MESGELRHGEEQLESIRQGKKEDYCRGCYFSSEWEIGLRRSQLSNRPFHNQVQDHNLLYDNSYKYCTMISTSSGPVHFLARTSRTTKPDGEHYKSYASLSGKPSQ